jgi:hypothetical protein
MGMAFPLSHSATAQATSQAFNDDRYVFVAVQSVQDAGSIVKLGGKKIKAKGRWIIVSLNLGNRTGMESLSLRGYLNYPNIQLMDTDQNWHRLNTNATNTDPSALKTSLRLGEHRVLQLAFDVPKSTDPYALYLDTARGDITLDMNGGKF